MNARVVFRRPLSSLRPLSSPATTSFPPAWIRPFSDSRSETLTASRSLRYPTLPIYDIITSIESYPDFVPFCTSAHITSFSEPDAHYGRRWPERASLSIGYGTQFNETFVSRIYCVPPTPEEGRAGLGIVEAISGSATHNLDADLVSHHSAHSAADAPAGPLQFLRTRWTLQNYPFKPAPPDGKPAQEGEVEPTPKASQMTDVGLTLEYKFSNPLYEIMSRAVAGKIADRMIEAFVKRVETVLKDADGADHAQQNRFQS